MSQMCENVIIQTAKYERDEEYMKKYLSTLRKKRWHI